MQRSRRSSTRLAARNGSSVANAREETGIGMRYMEENVLAMLDSQGVKNAESIQDDKLSFLDVVYAEFVLSSQASRPTKGIYKAVYSCLQECNSMEVAVASYRLLKDMDELLLPTSSSTAFFFGCVDILSLMEDFNNEVSLGSHCLPAKTLLFEYSVTQWLTNMERYQNGEEQDSYFYQQLEVLPKLSRSLFDLFGITLTSLELDFLSREIIQEAIATFFSKIFDMDEVSEKARDLFVDKLQYDKQELFLQIMRRPEQKLELIIKYLSKHLTKKAVGGKALSNLKALLECIADKSTIVALAKSVKEQWLQILLAHAFQAFLCVIPSQDAAAVAGLLLATFELLQSSRRDLVLHPSARQALCVAEVIKA